MEKVLRLGADPAEDAEDGLDEERRLDESAVDEMRQIVEVPDVIALELEARSEIAEFAHAALDLGEGIRQDEIGRACEIGLFPSYLNSRIRPAARRC